MGKEFSVLFFCVAGGGKDGRSCKKLIMSYIKEKQTNKQISHCVVNFDLQEFYSILKFTRSICPSVVFLFVS